MFNQIKSDISKELSVKRYEHVLRVVQTADTIAQKYNVNQKQVKLAAISHDITKEKSLSWQLKQFEQHNMKDPFILTTEPVMHSITGAYYISEHYKINDSVVLNAIKYHTLGNPEMDEVAMVVFIADYIEPKRTQPGVESLREMIGEESLSVIVKEIVKREINYLESNGKQVYSKTQELFELL